MLGPSILDSIGKMCCRLLSAHILHACMAHNCHTLRLYLLRKSGRLRADLRCSRGVTSLKCRTSLHDEHPKCLKSNAQCLKSNAHRVWLNGHAYKLSTTKINALPSGHGKGHGCGCGQPGTETLINMSNFMSHGSKADPPPSLITCLGFGLNIVTMHTLSGQSFTVLK